MGDRKLTLFELHLHGDTQFGPSIGKLTESGDGEEGAGEESGDDVPEIEVEAGEGSPVKGLLGLIALVLLVVMVKRLLGGDDEEEFEDDDG